jgi:hypothetical protein
MSHPTNSASATLAFVLSEPRSGSTVLSAMLDRRRGVISLPESSFPQVLGMVTHEERKDPRKLAALYLGSTFPPGPNPPTPLTAEDAAACMEGSNEQILINLGLALAQKIGRNPEEVSTVLWKTTRTINMNRGPLSTSGKFVVLRRNRQNVFESQFRVDFGIRNRNPWRYAIFAQSYEKAFGSLPKHRTFEIDYESIPERMAELFDFLGLKDQGEWGEGVSSFDTVAKNCSWLTEITGEFKNTDAEKRERLETVQKRSLDRALFWTKLLRPFMGPIRDYYDRQSLGHIREDAKMHFKSNK